MDTVATTRSFYQSLYARGRTSPEAQLALLAHATRSISEEGATGLEDPIDATDVGNTISHLARWKAPGPDGLPAEFYRTFSTHISPFLARLFEECIADQILPASFGSSRVVLLFKKGDRTDLANWRPISLMNIDEKIISKILTDRLQECMPTIISPAQTGFIKGRSIFDNIWALEHALEAGHDRSLQGSLTFLDQEKAYDRVDHAYLFACLENAGIGGTWLSWIRLTYGRLSASITVNGFISDPLAVKQGLRQGDPLSPLLYNIVLEPLLRYLETHIRGLKFGTFSLRTMAYADDLVVALRNRRDARTLDRALRLHRDACNAKVNDHKTLSLFLPGTQPFTRFQRIAWDVPFKYLGIQYQGGRVAWHVQREQILSLVTQRLESWKDRALSISGRILLLNTFALSRLWYAAHVVPFDRTTTKQLESRIRTFLWNGGKARVSLVRINHPRRVGGLGLLPIELQSQSLLAKWFKRVLDPEGPPWCALARELLLQQFAKVNLPPHALLTHSFRPANLRRLSEIWRSRLAAWTRLGGTLTSETSELPVSGLLALPLERALLLRESGEFLRPTWSWKRYGVSCVNDLFSWSEDRSAYWIDESRSPLHRRIAVGIRSRTYTCIPGFSSIYAAEERIPDWSWAKIMCELATIAHIKIIEYTPKAARMAQQADLPQHLSKLTSDVSAGSLWRRVFDPKILPKLQSFLWLLHSKAIRCGKQLADWYGSPRPCPHCNDEPDTLEHAFYFCPPVRAFWTQVESSLTGENYRHLSSSAAFALTFNPRPNTHPATRTLTLACALWSIHRARIQALYQGTQHETASLERGWRPMIISILMAKQKTAVERGTVRAFVANWGWVADAVGHITPELPPLSG
jgi:Reverse transcriptase (RNA-dependent DNA polymerase)/zinc-binding in reverse transcriptase